MTGSSCKLCLGHGIAIDCDMSPSVANYHNVMAWLKGAATLNLKYIVHNLRS